MTFSIDITIPEKQIIETETSVNEIQTLNANINIYDKDHNQLTNRDMVNQHPISAITGLSDALDNITVTETEPIYTADKPNIALKSELPNVSNFITLAQSRQGISESAVGLEYTNTTGVISLTDGYLIPTLSAFNNKVDSEVGKGLSENDFTDADKSKLDSIVPTSGLTYKGTWDASTENYPTATPSNGDYWVISVAGTIATVQYFVGDQIAYSTLDGWERLATGGAQNDEVVHNTGDETVYGNKTFDDVLVVNDRVGIGSSTFDMSNPEFLKVDGGTSASVNIISGYSDYDDYVQLNIKNNNDGVYASSDFVATADIGQEGANYIDVGINNSNYASPEFNIVTALDGYMFVDGGNLAIGTASTDKDIVLFTGGTLQENKRVTVSDSGMIVDGTISASNLSNTNTGDQDLSGLATKIELQKVKNLAIAMAVAL